MFQLKSRYNQIQLGYALRDNLPSWFLIDYSILLLIVQYIQLNDVLNILLMFINELILICIIVYSNHLRIHCQKVFIKVNLVFKWPIYKTI